MLRFCRGAAIRVSHEAQRAYHAAMNIDFRLAVLLGLSGLTGAGHAAATDEPWAVAGQQGLVRLVIVPAALARDEQAYVRQLPKLCEPDRTCFLNFYTNSTGAALAVPLPDAIANEATATFRRSSKQGAERFLWSCRLKMPQEGCF